MHSFRHLRRAHVALRSLRAGAFWLLTSGIVPSAMVGCGSAPVSGDVQSSPPDLEPPLQNDNLVDSVIDDQTPVRAIRATPLDGEGSRTWSFNVLGATASERETHRFSWSFGDGGLAEGDRLNYTYSGPGQYVVGVGVTDPAGVTAYTLAEIVTVTSSGDGAPTGSALVVMLDARVENADSVFTLYASARTNELEPGETVEFTWRFADGTDASGSEVVRVLEGASPYRVEVVAHTSSGRTATHFAYFLLAASDGAPTDVDTSGDETDPTVDDNENDNTAVEPPPGSLKAFPSAQGFGALARGGRGGQVVYVTTLEDFPPILENGQGNTNPILGSLRWACEWLTGPRTILFKVGGTIQLTERVFLLGEEGSYVTIAGQSAPGGGIQITGYPIHVGAGAHDVVIRYLRSRPGWTGPEDLGVKDALTIHSENGLTSHVIVDHCSLEWAMDECGGVGDNTENITFQWCIFGEGSAFGLYDGPGNSLGMLVSGGIPSDWFLTLHHCLFVNNGDRNPYLTQNGGVVDLVNNYICNYSIVGTPITPYETNSPRANFVRNVYSRAATGIRPIVVHTYNSRTIAPASLYVEGNLHAYAPTATNDEWEIVRDADGTGAASLTFRRLTPWPVPEAYRVTADPAEQVVDRVLAQVGANYPAYDVVDQRLLVEARNLTGDPGFGPSITDHEDWPFLAPGTPYLDADDDGMDDVWETARSLNPTDSADGVQDDDGDGYTNLEEFLNGLVGE